VRFLQDQDILDAEQRRRFFGGLFGLELKAKRQHFFFTGFAWARRSVWFKKGRFPIRAADWAKIARSIAKG
jgi:hypothetical protein